MFVLCQRNPAGPGGANTLHKSDLAGYWAEYKCVITSDYSDATGKPVHEAHTTNDSLDITNIICFDSSSLRWYSAMNHPACYTKRDSSAYQVHGDTLISTIFDRLYLYQGSDTLWAVNLISKVNGEFIRSMSMAGNWNGRPGRFNREFHYCAVESFPPSYWPVVECY
jgi:hypothetical protein